MNMGVKVKVKVMATKPFFEGDWERKGDKKGS